MSGADDFELRLGPIRDRGPRSRTFVSQVLEAAVRAGYVRRGAGGGRRGAGARGAGRGRGAALAASLRSPGRRVVAKTRIVRHAGRSYRAAPLTAHLRYLRREGVDRTGSPGGMFDARGPADPLAFAARCEADRHHFRFIVAPEDAASLADMRAFARELMGQAEADLGTRLDWIAIDHWNTGHPHLHILVRGRDDRGQDLVIAREYLTRGLRWRAERLATLELGPRTAREVAAALERDTRAERWTRLDGLALAEAKEGRLDLRPGPGGVEPDVRPLLAGRATVLERLGLARPEGPGVWRLAPDLRARLQALGDRGDIIATLHRAAGEGRPLSELAPHAESLAAPVLGRLVERGLHDELRGEAFAIVDGIDGRLHHLRLADLAATGDTPIGGLVEARAGPQGLRLVHRSDLGLDAQVAADGATWLDRQLLSREPAQLAENGFGAEVRAALERRRERLAEEGLARRDGRRMVFAGDLLATLRRRELARAGAMLSEETGLRFMGEDQAPDVRGRYLRRVDLASGRFAMVEEGLGFRLAPWAQALDRKLGREVRGTITPEGMSWELGPGRGLSR